MPTPSRKLTNVVVWLTLMAALTIRAQDSAGDEVVTMEAFNVTAYHRKIPIIDGFTAKIIGETTTLSLISPNPSTSC